MILSSITSGPTLPPVAVIFVAVTAPAFVTLNGALANVACPICKLPVESTFNISLEEPTDKLPSKLPPAADKLPENVPPPFTVRFVPSHNNEFVDDFKDSLGVPLVTPRNIPSAL